MSPVYVLPPPKPTVDPTSFDSAWVDAVAPPAVAVTAILVTASPLGFALAGFHLWIHEFGHATVAWLCGKRALPLPIGWTNIAFARSNFVYFGVLLLLGLLFGAGARERKVLPMIVAVAVAGLQYFMTWRLPEETARLWITFAGVGGEFYLSTAAMVLFYFQLPDKFRWGLCRYVFLFLGASGFYGIFTFWRRVQHGLEGIPYGSLVNGEDDQSGDMDALAGDFHWTQHQIIGQYNHLGSVCLAVLLVTYTLMAAGLGRWLRRVPLPWTQAPE